MIWVSRLLRVGIVFTCLAVLSGIVPISLTHFRTGNACPMLGPIPACYLVTICYSAMAVAALLWWKRLIWLFSTGATPVVLLALVGTTLELSGKPTCPLSDTGLPLCYASLVIGCGLVVGFILITRIERKYA